MLLTPCGVQEGHGRPADIWSLGCCVIEMATGLPPWSDKHKNPVAAMYYCASTGVKPQLPRNDQMPHGPWSAEARDFLSQCFERVPKNRPNATSLLMHPWLAGVVVPSSKQAAAVPQMPAHVRQQPPSPIKEEEAPSPPVAPVPRAPPPAASALAQRPGFAVLDAPAWASPQQETLMDSIAGASEGLAAAGERSSNTLMVSVAAGGSGMGAEHGPSRRVWGDETLDAAVDAEMLNMGSVQASMLTMNFNPMEEPSWLPNGPQVRAWYVLVSD